MQAVAPKNRRIAATALLLFALASVVACGGGPGGKATPTPTASSTPQATASGSATSSFDSVYFVDAQRGWVAGIKDGSDVILATSDGGKTWNQQYSTSAPAVISDLSFISSSLGWAIQTATGSGTQSTLLQTSDGETWQPVVSMGEPLGTLQMTSSSDGWAFRRPGKDRPAQLLHTQDAGRTWTTLLAPVDTSSICSADTGVVWVATTGGQILRSSDRGITWNTSFTAPEDLRRLNSNRMWCRSSGLVWSSFDDGVGGGGETFAVYRSTNGGTTWEAVRSGRAPGVIGIVDEHTVYAAAYCGPCSPSASIDKTTDGGMTWQPLHVQPELSVVSRFSCADSAHCWLIGAKAETTVAETPVILATADGGKTWVQQYP